MAKQGFKPQKSPSSSSSKPSVTVVSAWLRHQKEDRLEILKRSIPSAHLLAILSPHLLSLTNIHYTVFISSVFDIIQDLYSNQF